VALGMAHYTNENTMFNIGISLDSHDNMVNAGITHKFGYSPEKKAIPDRYKGGPISSIYVMQDEMQALLAKDQEKDDIITKQADELDVLRKQNEDMQRKIDMILAKLQ
jgi:hep/hag repeat protein